MKKRLSLIITFFLMTYFGCAPRTGGFAPSSPLPATDTPPIASTGWDIEINQGEKVSSPNFWESTLSSNELSETIITTSGWTAEIVND